jgi:signal transduction histidine kinase
MISEALRRAPLLAGLPDDALEELVAAGSRLELGPGDVLLAEGEAPDAAYLVLEGELAISKRLDGTDVVLASTGVGELLGELAVAHGRPRSATARASTRVVVLRLEPEALETLLTAPKLGLTLLSTATRRLEELELQLRQHARMATLGTLSAGLLHELNNPSAAIASSVARLDRLLTGWLEVDRTLSGAAVRDQLIELLTDSRPGSDPVARLDAEDELLAVCRSVGVAQAVELAAPLAEVGVDAERLRSVLTDLPPAERDPAARWLTLRARITSTIGEASVASERISEIVGSVKRYSHTDQAPARWVDVHEGLEAALTILRGRIPPDVELVRDYAVDLPEVPGHPGDLDSVWTNLLDNALDAVGDRGTITIRTRLAGDHVRVEVENTGPAIPPEVLERVFDPFFTTKPVGRGTGLGLATAYSVITSRHDGRLLLASEPGRTVARVELPTGRP